MLAEEQYVTFDTAKLLKRNGFSEKCRIYYLKDGNRYEHCHQEVLPRGETVYNCPTQAIALQWLREEYKIAVLPMPYRYPGKWIVCLVYLGRPMENDDKYDCCELKKVHLSYEDAAEYGIKYATKGIVAKIRKALLKKLKEEKV